MAEYFSQSAYKRLPAAIQGLPEKEKAAFIFLRMKRNDAFIAKELDVSLTEAKGIILNVQETLIKSGTLDLIKDPVFYQIDHPKETDSGDGRSFELPAHDMDMVDQITLDHFYKAIGDSLNELPKPNRRLMSLWFNKEMTAKDILSFYKKLGLPITDRKPIGKTTEQDVFYALEKNIKKLLEIVRTHLDQEGEELTPSALKAILNETGV